MASLVDACQRAHIIQNHDEWIQNVADVLLLGGNDLWRAMCISYIQYRLDEFSIDAVTTSVSDALENL